MSDIEDVKRVLGEAEEYAAALDRREERREIYQRVAVASIYTSGEDDHLFLYWKPESTAKIAEAIYQGMLKFAGEAK